MAAKTEAITELRYRAFTIGEWMREARGLLLQAASEAREITEMDRTCLERYDFEVDTLVDSIRTNLDAALVDRTDCSVNVIGEEARDLVDLIDLALTPRREEAVA